MNKRVIYKMVGLYRDDFQITGYEFGEGKKSVCIIGSSRGNEVQQIYCCSKLVKKFRQLEAEGRIRKDHKILIIPSLNPYSMNIQKRFWPTDNTDINRMFPGYDLGETTQRIADGVFREISEYQFGIQFTSFYMPGNFVPHIRLMDEGYSRIETAMQFGLPYGKREVLGMWVGGNESAKYWLSVLNETKNRGVEDIMIVSVDGLTGFGDAIHAVFPQAEIQRCIVHQIRYSTKFISYKDLKPFIADLKLVYKADTEDLALTALEDLEEKWGKKYPDSIGSWRNNWTQLSTYFKYPSEIRKLIYTTNSIENFNRQLRKVTKSKTIFSTDDALFKMLYLAMMDATKKWTGKAWDWGLTLDQLCIYFGDRIQPEDID